MNVKIKNIINNIYSELVVSESEKKIRASIRELKSYSDAELTDLGIARISIEECIRGTQATEYQRNAA